jgi:hypothetical protein
MAFELVVQAPPDKRTTVVFQVPQDPWPVILAWAQKKGYVPLTAPPPGGAGSVVFQKGSGFWVAPMMCAINVMPPQVTVQGWARGTFIARLMSFFILPAEMGIASGGFRGALPRKMARGHVNELLMQLGAPQIQ